MSGTADERKPTIPSKSSLEILSELFSTFDAEPPVIVKKEKSEDSSKKHKKSKKKKKDHKHKKHKKKSKKRRRSRSISASSDSESSGIDLTEILIKRDVDKCVKVEPKASAKIKRDTKKATSDKKPKNNSSKNQSESSSSDNESDDSPAPPDSKFSSIFHVALQTLQEREKLKREQFITDTSDNKHKRKVHEDDIKNENKLKTELDITESEIVECKADPNEAEETRTNSSEIHRPSNSNELESETKLPKNSKTDTKTESNSKQAISPIIFTTEDVSSESKHRKSTKRKEVDISKSQDRDRDKSRHKDSYHRDGDLRRKDGDSHRRSGEHHHKGGDSSHHGDGRNNSHRHNDRDKKRRHGDRHREDNFYRKKDESRSSTKRKNRSPSPDRVAGFSQGNLVSTRLGNPFYIKTPNETKYPFYFQGARSPPPAMQRPCNKEDRWSIRERFRRQTSEVSGGSSGGSSIGIDKKKLLEIARKNAVQMIKSGSLPEALKLGMQAQEKVLAAIRSGGKTVDELTDFCRTLSQKEELGELSSLSDGETRSDEPDSDTEQAFHHPFQLKERPQSITVNIKNATPLPIRSTTERPTELHLQFPVSSGQLHRKTESEWTPVKPTAPPVVVAPQPKPPAKKDVAIAAIAAKPAVATPAPPTPVPTPVPPTPIPKPIAVAPVKRLPPPPPPPPPALLAFPTGVPVAFNPVPVAPPITVHAQQRVILPPPMPPPIPPPMLPPPSPPALLMSMYMEQPPVPGVVENCEPTVQQQIAEQQKMDVASIVAQRLTAMRKLQENPNDVQAISEIYKAQREMNFWVECKQQFGQFTGSTGAQIMSQAELNAGYQAWARRDQLQTAAPVTGGMGMHLLQKMGWRPGEGLGKEKTGALEPLLLEVKLDKKGVVAKEEAKGGRGGRGGHAAANKTGPSTVKQAVKVMQGKHPVSLLSEYASKRRLGPPEYALCFECGPDHKKNFVFKVVLNGLEYKPTMACGNKKEAKAMAAQVCLQQIGMLPHVPSAGGQQAPM